MKKLKVYFSIALLFAIFILLNSCSTSWTTAIQWGSIVNSDFEETIDVEVERGLIIIPVKIHDKRYRFLFDNGATMSISEELQSEYNFQTVSTGHIVDSEKSRKKVSYIQIDTLLLNKIPFIEQTAFVGDFNSNPVIKCLEIDGIIGSNLIRFCNWKIDFENQQITISNASLLDEGKSYASTEFKVDNQYSNLVNIKTGSSTIQDMKIDYGSNGSLSVPGHVFSTLKDNDIITHSYSESGVTQSGIIGDTKKTKREIAWLETIQINDFWLNDVIIRSSKSGLVGTKILSKQNVIINWKEQKLHFENVDYEPNSRKVFGCNFGVMDDGTVYIQSVLENSNAYLNGLRPHMKVLKIDTLDFKRGHNFCDCVNYISKADTMHIEISEGADNSRRILLTRKVLIPVE